MASDLDKAIARVERDTEYLEDQQTHIIIVGDPKRTAADLRLILAAAKGRTEGEVERVLAENAVPGSHAALIEAGDKAAARLAAALSLQRPGIAR